MTTEVLVDPELERLSPHEQAYRHLAAVLPTRLLPFEAIEVRCLDTRTKPAKPGPRLFLDSIDAVVEAAMKHRGEWDVFFGVGSRACPGALSLAHCRHAEKGADHVSRLQVAWGDFDVKDGLYGSQDEIVGRLDALVLPPSCMVSSGGGIHAYWRLSEPTSDALRVEAVNRSLRLRFGADNAVDAARILRVAGTYNYKYGEPLPVTLLRCDVHA